MEERYLKRTAIIIFLCMLAIIALSIYNSRYTSTFLNLVNKDASEELSRNTDKSSNSVTGYVSNNKEIKDAVGSTYIAITKPENKEYNVEISNLYMDRKISISIEDLDITELKEEAIVRINQNTVYSGHYKVADEEFTDSSNTDVKKSALSKYEISFKNDTSNNQGIYVIPHVIKEDGSVEIYGDIPQDLVVDPVMSFTCRYEKNQDSKVSVIEFLMNKIYEPFIYQDDLYIYIALKNPKEIYKKIVVVDAGHGGKDPGAYSKIDNNVYEKDINLSILLKLKGILELNKDIKVYYTRTKDETVYLNPRVNLANELDADLFISIHCNSSESSTARGVEVLYNENHDSDGLVSKELAELLLNELKGLTGKVNRGLVPASEIVVVGKAKVPVALVETGFLSNINDYTFLVDSENQTQIAQSIYKVIMDIVND